MKNCLRYLLRPMSIQLGVLTCVIVLMTGGRALVHEGSSLLNFFTTYLTAIPVVIVLVFYISSFSLTTTVLNIALSMGARRKDYFAALQILFLLLIAYSWLIQFGVDQLTIRFGWESMEAWDNTLVSRNPQVPIIHLLTLMLGCLLSLLATRHMRLGLLITFGGCIAVTVLLYMAMFIYGTRTTGLWGDLPWILPTAALIGVIGCEFGLHRAIRKAVAA